MAATAYAALVSLMNVLNRVQHPTCPATFDKSQIKALFDRVSLLVGFFETHSHNVSKDLQMKIINAADGAQDRIESFVMVRIYERRAGKRVDLSLNYVTRDHLDKDIQRLDLIVQEAAEVEQLQKGDKNQQPRNSLHVGSSQPPSGTLQFLGFEEEVNRLLERITRDISDREIIPVVGMGGIGKSTLAVSVYNLPYIRRAFDVKGWVTISQVYDIGTVIHSLLDEFGVPSIDKKDLDESGVQLYKYLFGRKYFIIFDDVWDIKAWEGISRYFPANRNGSRVILTTRSLDVARSVGSGNAYEMQLLDDEKSWDLLNKVVFGQKVCPDELQTYGKGIAKGCRGLPLAVVVIGGMLKTHDTTVYWAYVCENVSSIIRRGDDEHCLNILSWSYHELPIHLKPCFLYMACFPEDYEIRVSELIKLWDADGFLKPNMDKTPEEVALEYLDNLVERSIVIVKQRNIRGSMKGLILHDLVRDLCIREARAEMFLSVDVRSGMVGSCRRQAVLEGDYSFVSGRLQSLLWFTRADPPYMSLSLLRVFLMSFSHLVRHPDTFMPLVNLRFVKSADRQLLLYKSNDRVKYDSPSTLISPLPFMWNLETLILYTPGSNFMSLPPEIWKLPLMKHLILGRHANFPDPPAPYADSVLSNLQTLRKAIISSNKVLHRIPNIKDLEIQYTDYLKELPAGFWNLVHCDKLERLHLYGRITLPPNERNAIKLFPTNLKKLTLSESHIPWERMTIVGSLPNLQVLKLKYDAFIGNEWITSEGEFESLIVLSIDQCSLATWIVENISHFPCLEHLRYMLNDDLGELPEVFADSMTLKSIDLMYCSASLAISGKEILDEQEVNGNNDLTLEVSGIKWDNVEQMKEMKSLASDRFRIECYWPGQEDA